MSILKNKTMKRILFLVILLIGLSVMTIAQNRTGTIPAGSSYGIVYFDASDTITANQTEYIVQFNAAQNWPTTQDLEIKMDSVDVPNVDVVLTGSKFGSTYADIGSAVTWSGSSADTTIIISNATKNRYRFYRVKFTRASGDANVTGAKLKLFYE